MKSNKFKQFSVLAMMATLFACSKGGDSFSILADSKTFKQSTAYVAKPVDILWVIDNSGSMGTSQANLASNFESFIDRFQTLGHDFRMGVTSTDAYRADLYYHDPAYSKLRDGDGISHSGIFVIDKNTPNLSNVFVTNIKLGILGWGDERPFQSLKSTLDNALNADFRRPEAFLAIIIVSDEDDFSHNGTSLKQDYNYSGLHPVSNTVTYLDNLTNSTPGSRNYSVNTISIMDAACLAQLQKNGQKIGLRIMQLAADTGGTQGSLCGNFGETLEVISGSVLSLSSNFVLDREPILGSINITVNGSSVPEDPQNGWSFDPATNSITFHGTGLPPTDADIQINFDPKNVII